MLGFHLSYSWIRWSKPDGPPPTLPAGIQRLFVKTADGDIELLYAAPQGAHHHATPFFFVHGGMGSASVWLEYMQYLSEHGIPCYAVSLRGHGRSWHPSYLKMVYCTTRRMLADDLVSAVKFAQEREHSEVILVGHSSGGGLSQYILSDGNVRAKALVLAAAVPGFGSTGVYMNWWRLDPWFTIRMVFHGWHPNSPLSHPVLTRKVFFSNEVSDEHVEKFQRNTNAYESFLWPISMMRQFVNAKSLLSQISGWGNGERVMVLHGGSDKIMTLPIMQRLAGTYREAFARLVAEKKIEAKVDAVQSLGAQREPDDAGEGVRFCTVPGAGHHLQNDAMWRIGAQKLLEFYQQL